jgi:RNA polymerase sigma-70 factor, ECF subfamily
MIDSDTDKLVTLAAQGDLPVMDRLMQRHRQRLRKMVAVRMDERLAARVDPSDVVQETLAEAAGKLREYAKNRPIPFYPWLRQLAWNRLVDLHRRHILSQRRSVSREEERGPPLDDRSALDLAERLLASDSGPVRRLLRSEVRRRVRDALDQLDERDRELLVMRHLEQLSIREIAALLSIREGAVKTRLVRALKRLRDRLGELNDTEEE